MANAVVIINGDQIEFMGDITISPLPYTNTAEASRSGRVFTTSEAKPRTLTIEGIKVDLSEIKRFTQFFETCGTKRFTLTVVIDEDCAEEDGGANRYHFVNCVLQGEFEAALFGRSVSGFEVAYEQCIEVDGATTTP
jgi:hypothetical protein